MSPERIASVLERNYNAMIDLPPLRVFWDLEDDPGGNVQHISEHGVTPEEVEQVLGNVTLLDVSRSSECAIAIGETQAGRELVVAFEEVDENAFYPITAYDLED